MAMLNNQRVISEAADADGDTSTQHNRLYN